MPRSRVRARLLLAPHLPTLALAALFGAATLPAQDELARVREWFADARNYAMYANDGGLYDDLAKYLKVR